MNHRIRYYKDSGLIVTYCALCAAEIGELPTECPGKLMSAEQRKSVALGELDYRAGQWVSKS